MSFDLKIDRICDHFVVEETVDVQTDQKKILIPRPLASTNSLILKKNGFVIARANESFSFTIQRYSHPLIFLRTDIANNNIANNLKDERNTINLEAVYLDYLNTAQSVDPISTSVYKQIIDDVNEIKFVNITGIYGIDGKVDEVLLENYLLIDPQNKAILNEEISDNLYLILTDIIVRERSLVLRLEDLMVQETAALTNVDISFLFASNAEVVAYVNTQVEVASKIEGNLAILTEDIQAAINKTLLVSERSQYLINRLGEITSHLNLLILRDELLIGFIPSMDVIIEQNPFKEIVFDKKIRSLDNFYEVSYLTNAEYCPKCSGVRIHQDLIYNTKGDFAIVEDEAKLMQDILKGTTTSLGSDAENDWYGTIIKSLIGTKIVNLSDIKLRIMQTTNEFLANLKELQAQQSVVQEVTDKETFFKLIELDVTIPNPDNPDIVEVFLRFRNRAGNDIEFLRDIQLPEPLNLLG